MIKQKIQMTCLAGIVILMVGYLLYAFNAVLPEHHHAPTETEHECDDHAGHNH